VKFKAGKLTCMGWDQYYNCLEKHATVMESHKSNETKSKLAMVVWC